MPGARPGCAEAPGAGPRWIGAAAPGEGIWRPVVAWTVEAGAGAAAGRCGWTRLKSLRNAGGLASAGALAIVSRETRTMFCCTGWRVWKAWNGTAVTPLGAVALRQREGGGLQGRTTFTLTAYGRL
jgi:hypothetical protein